MPLPVDDVPDERESQRRLIAALANPSCFPHPAPRIAVIETHISYVVLTGRYAYKIKKAVDLGFVDYKGLERRRFFCDEELRLNRRLAPDLYLDVVPIGGSAAKPHLGDTAAPIEYAVRMLEFEQDCLLERLLDRNGLLPQHVDHLSAALARFHAGAAVADRGSPHGTAAAIREPVRQNFDQLRSMGVPDAAFGDFVAIEAWTLAACDRLAPVFDERHAHGFVRECHGDLHLGNMLLREGEIEVFDGIEFNAELRWIDVMSDIAFLVMDLSERGRPDFGWRFLGDYLETAGDYGGLDLLPFYQVYRAMVRAKVARFRSRQDELPQASRDEAVAGCSKYLTYARRVIEAPSPILIAMHGFSASGKSHVARRICEQFGAVRIRSDIERKRLHGLPAMARSHSSVGSGIYDASATEETYRRLAELARRVTAAGYSAVVDATCLMRWQRQMFRRLAADAALPFVIVHCDAAADILRQRLIARDLGHGDASEATLAVLRAQRQSAEPFDPGESRDVLDIDTETGDTGTLMAQLRQRVGR